MTEITIFLAEGTLAQVCQDSSDAILLDWDFPGVNYQRLIHTLREHCPQKRLVATSLKPEHELAAHQVGTDVFISKQLPPDEFLAALRKFFEM